MNEQQVLEALIVQDPTILLHVTSINTTLRSCAAPGQLLGLHTFTVTGEPVQSQSGPPGISAGTSEGTNMPIANNASNTTNDKIDFFILIPFLKDF